MQPTITLVDFEQIISIKVDSIFPGHSEVDRKVFYLYKVKFHLLKFQLGFVQLSSYLNEDLQDLMDVS